MWLFTTIVHPVRIAFDLTEREYCIIDTIAQLSSNPSASNKGWCNAKNGTIAEWLGTSEKTIIATVKKGIELGLLEVEKINEYTPVLKRATAKWFDSINEVLPKVTQGITKGNTTVLPKVTQGITKGNTDNNINIHIDKDIDNAPENKFSDSLPPVLDSLQTKEIQEKEKSAAKKEKESTKHVEAFKQIIAHLNEKSGRNFQINANDEKGKTDKYKMVAKILDLGYTHDQIKSVITAKCAEWLNESKMSQYLQPATLFALRNFEKYIESLQAGTAKNTPQQPQNSTITELKNHFSISTATAAKFWQVMKNKYTKLNDQKLLEACKKLGDSTKDSISSIISRLDYYIALIKQTQP